MAKRLQLEPECVKFHPNGITTEGITPAKEPPKVKTLGYLARLCPLKGLDLLVDAFIVLKESPKFSDLCLEIAGGMTSEDEPYVEDQRRKLVQAGLPIIFPFIQTWIVSKN